jgi:hypothetical protein
VCSQCDPRAPVFFLSYAHPEKIARYSGVSHELDAARFFDDLSENVAALVGRRASSGADPGFIDLSTSAGAWESAILEKLGYCHSLVALLSPSYVESDWCGKEWYAFSRREIERRDPGGNQDHRAIFPVTWVPVDDSRIPAAVKEVEWFSPGEEYTGAYSMNGLFGLLRINEAAYRFTVWRLAQQIARSYHSYHVKPAIATPDNLQNVFLR